MTGYLQALKTDQPGRSGEEHSRQRAQSKGPEASNAWPVMFSAWLKNTGRVEGEDHQPTPELMGLVVGLGGELEAILAEKGFKQRSNVI